MFLTLMKNPISLSIWESSESCSVDLTTTEAAGSPNTQKYIFIPFSPASAGFFLTKIPSTSLINNQGLSTGLVPDFFHHFPFFSASASDMAMATACF